MSWLTTFNPGIIWVGLKGFYVLAFAVYAVFALIVLLQIRQMLTALSGGFDAGIKLIGWLHLMVALGALVLAVVVL